MKEYLALAGAGATPGANTNATTLYDSTVGYESGSAPVLLRYRRYLLSLQNSHAGTLKVYGSFDRGKTWDPAHVTRPIAGAPTNEIVVPLGVHPDIKVEWVNGGTAQNPWVVQQALDDDTAPSGAFSSDSTGSSSSSVTSTQLPTALGQGTKVQSLSIVEASDVDRAPLRGEVLVFAVTQASVPFNIPDGSIGGQPDWRGKQIEAFAELADVYIQFATNGAAAVNEAQASTTTAVSGRTSVAPQGDECVIIPRGCSRRIAILPTHVSFALKGPIQSGRLRTQIL